MYKGLLHPHILFTVLFVIHYIVKTALLLSNKEKLAVYAKKTKVIEMIISFLFLATGIGLFISLGSDGIVWTNEIIIKLVLVFASIPLAIVGFKKEKSALAIVSVLFLLGALFLGFQHKSKRKDVIGSDASDKMEEVREEGKALSGAELYKINCESCHGETGNAGVSGAKDLSISTLSVADKKVIVSKGKGNMTAYDGILNASEINSVVDYIETLKQ